MNLASNKEYLILNHNDFETFDVFNFCGFNQIFNIKTGYCQKIPQQGTGLFSIELPFEVKDQNIDQSIISDYEFKEKDETYFTSHGSEYSRKAFNCDGMTSKMGKLMKARERFM